MNGPIPIVISLDIEPDDRQPNLGESLPWRGFEKLVPLVTRLRRQLEKATGAPAYFTWALRLDPQIATVYGSADWPIRRYRPLLKALLDAGDEIGLHPHMWRWVESRDDWVADLGDERWVAHCVRTSLGVYRDAFHRTPRAVKIGDHFITNRVVRQIDREGVACDLTIEPGLKPASHLHEATMTGALPDLSDVPNRPFRPSMKDFRRPGRYFKRRLWMIPVTTGRLLSPLSELPDPDPESLTMLLGYPIAAIRQIFDQAVLSPRPFVVGVGRTDVLLNRFDGEQFKAFFEYLMEHPLRRRFRIVTPLEAVRQFVRPVSASYV